MIERDYIMRMIAQLAAVMAKILGAKSAQNYAEARQIAQNAYAQLFGLNGELVEHLDAPTLALLVGGKEKIKALAALLREEGEILHLQGNPSESNKKFEKSLALYQEALRLSASGDAECETAMEAIKTTLGMLAKSATDKYI